MLECVGAKKKIMCPVNVGVCSPTQKLKCQILSHILGTLPTKGLIQCRTPVEEMQFYPPKLKADLYLSQCGALVSLILHHLV